MSSIGQDVPMNVQKQLQRQVNTMIGWSNTEEAPMVIPKPVTRSSLDEIADRPHFVCEKSDGIRYLALLMQNGCYLIQSNYQFRYVPLFCPLRPDRVQPGSESVHQWTLLDGHLVVDDDNGKKTVAFLVYDALALNGHSVMALQLHDRLKMIQNDIIAPRKSCQLPKNHPAEKFQLVLQSMYPVQRVTHVIRNIIPRLNRPNEALLFIPVSTPYSPGNSKTVQEWKQKCYRRAHFQLRIEWRGSPPTPGYKLMIREKRTHTFFDWITLGPEDYQAISNDKKSSSRIVECIYDREWPTFIPGHDKSSWEVGNPDFQHEERGKGWRTGGWKFVRFRDDIGVPIERSIMSFLEQSISDGLGLEDFESAFPDDPVKAAAQAKLRKAAADKEIAKRIAEQEKVLAEKRQKTAGNTPRGIGVCYDFQNKGDCRRGEHCHFSHCACNTSCTCTSESNTFGIRSVQKEEGEEADDEENEEEAMDVQNEEAEVTLTPENLKSPLRSFDKESIAAKLVSLNATTNSRIWSSLGIPSNRDRVKRVAYGFTVHSSGKVEMKSRPTAQLATMLKH